MAPIAVEAAWPEDAGLVAWAVAARCRRIPAGMPVVRVGTVPSNGCDDPAVCGGSWPICPMIGAQEAPALHGATPCAGAEPRVSAEPCAAGNSAIPRLARPVCVPPTGLPAIRFDRVGNCCVRVADALPSDAAIVLFHAA